jgi:ribosome-associated protein
MAKTQTGSTVRTSKARAAAASGRDPHADAATKLPRLPKRVAEAVRAARDKKAWDLVVLDLRKAGGFTDYFVICTGTSTRHIHALADGIEHALRTEFGERPALAEGVKKSEWILLDYFNFVVHVFSRECRAYYGLERLWGNARRYDFPNP